MGFFIGKFALLLYIKTLKIKLFISALHMTYHAENFIILFNSGAKGIAITAATET